MITYNQERYLADAIESVLCQDAPFGVEVVLGVDRSSDGTAAVATRYRDQNADIINCLLRNENWGVHRNLMDVFARCRGDYIALLEGDDYWVSPLKLQKQVEYLAAHPDASTCFHTSWVVHEDGSRVPYLFPETDRDDFDLRDLLHGNMMQTASVMFRRSAFPGFPDWYPRIPTGDWVIHILNAQHGPIHRLREPMSVYRVHAQGYWYNRPHAERAAWRAEMLEAMRGLLAPSYRATIDHLTVKVRLDLALQDLEAGNFTGANLWLKRALLTKGIHKKLRDVLGVARRLWSARLLSFFSR